MEWQRGDHLHDATRDAALIALQKAGDAVREPIDVELPATHEPDSSATCAALGRAAETFARGRAAVASMHAHRPIGDQRLGAERRVLAVLASRHPARFTRAQLGTLAGLAHTGGTFSTYLSRLRSNGLLEERGAELRASAVLMGEA